MLKYLRDLEIGDKFWFDNCVYLVIDFNLCDFTANTFYTNLVAVLDLNTYKIVALNKDLKIIQDKDNISI